MYKTTTENQFYSVSGRRPKEAQFCEIGPAEPVGPFFFFSAFFSPAG
jgi:hypothetical protein